jgi:(4-(4-[2-(gamma-L-glutamylamino)ethyl]phenoxymethyl)furan-2-yl)methanamine synthase
LVTVLGYDIGGANTKAVALTVEKGNLKTIKVAVEYFPVWKEPQKLASVLLKLQKRLGANRFNACGLTMTAELSDAYQTKRQGVHQILDSVTQAFPNMCIYVLNTDAKLISPEAAGQEPLGVAAANWAATGWIVAQQVKDCIIVDIGSTSTSIIPIANGQLAAKGKNDLEKLMCGELVYTGSLRTNVAAIVQSVPVKGGVAGVASELFALSGDVHLVLGNISQTQYTSETADGRAKTIPNSLARLARIVCADTEMLTKPEITAIAKYIYGKQVEQIAEGLAKVYTYTKKLTICDLPIVVTGLGKDFLAKKAAEKIGADNIVDLGTLLQKDAVLATPAYAVALMTAKKNEGESSK